VKPISAAWRKIIMGIPGYDCMATAGDCWFDAQAAARALGFFADCIKHVKGERAGHPFVLEPWQQSIVANMFAWKRPDGTRRYREVLIYVPRKNGKSTLLGGMVLMFLFCDGERGAELYSAAADRDQAALVYDQAKGMVLQEPELSSRARVYATGKSIVYGAMGSTYKAISAEAGTKHGYNTHFAVIDELHAQPNRDLVDVLMTSTGARRQPMVVHITTADYQRPDSICNEKHDYASKVRDGVIEDRSFLPVIYEAKRGDDWTDPKVWSKANPNLGISVSLEYIQRECQRAQDTPGYENTFKRLHLNMITEQAERWLAMERWDACSAPLPELDGLPCFAGLDLATTTDIAALVLDFPLEGGRHVWLPFFWVPRDNAIKREKKDRVPYSVWIRDGLVRVTEGDVIDYDVIRRDIGEIGKRYNIRELAIDRWSATQITTQLTGDGLTVVPFGQGFASMSGPSKELEKLVLSQQLQHGGNPVLRWMASNVAIDGDAAGNIKPSKKRSTEKIDGIVAGVMGLGRAIVADPKFGKSVYDLRGLSTV
jgi:phage terminase large subunit-like protein